MYKAEHTSVHVNENVLLRNISLSFVPGTVSVIVGANGAGKSTLLKVLTGDITPTSGAVSLHGQSIASICPKRLAQQRSVMPQSSSLDFSFRVEEVVDMGRAPHAAICSPRKNREIVWQAMKDMDVGHLRYRDYTTLSGGEKQRVHLARVLSQVWEPKPYPDRFMLLDEPTSNLDVHHQHQTLSYLKTVAQCGIGIIIVLHDLNLASLYADTICILKKGELIAQGTPNEVFYEKQIEDAFQYKAHIQQHPDSDRPLIIPVVTHDSFIKSKPDSEKQEEIITH